MARRLTLALLSAATAASLIAVAPSLTPLAAQGSGATVFQGARLIVGNGTTIDKAAFVVENGRIAQAGPADQIKAPAGAARVDLAGKTVMPAIVDAHTHMATTREL